MKKEGYNTLPANEKQRPIQSRPTDLTEGESSTETGARGWNLQEMSLEQVSTSPQQYQTEKPPKQPNEVLPKELLDLMVSLGDGLDESKEEALADFSDFLLRKFAEAIKPTDYTEAFNQLMIKINNADLVDTNETLKKLTKIYSRTIVVEHLKHQDLEQAKESAYKKVLHRADQYLSKSS